MPRKLTRILSKRRFIDKIRRADSYITAEISRNQYEGQPYPEIDATLSMADCTRKISWDFGIYVYGEKPKQARKYLKEMREKARKSKELIDEFYQKLEEEYKQLEEILDADVSPLPPKETKE